MRARSEIWDAGRERPLLRRASRTVALQFGVALALVVLSIGAIALILDEKQEHQQAEQAGRRALAGAIDLTAAPTNVWFVISDRQGHRTLSPGAPAGLHRLDPRTLRDGPTELSGEGRELVAFTGDRAVGRVSAVYDLSPREAEERPLLISLGTASLVGIALTAAISGLMGRRAVRPLGIALAIQRQFVTDASHELRTPLTVLMLRAETLQRRLPSSTDPELATELARLVADASVLSEVVTDLLLSAELAHSPQHGETVDLWGIVGDVSDSLQPLAEQRSITLTATCGTGGPPGPAAEHSVRVRGAPGALRRAVTSLVDNALAHTPRGGQVQIGVQRQAGTVRVYVRDDGEGWDPRDTGPLRERFARGTSDDRGQRFGLGLALVDEVARAHGGHLEVGGEPGGGAAVTIVLPHPG